MTTQKKSKDILGQLFFTIGGAIILYVPGVLTGMQQFAYSQNSFNGAPGYEGGIIIGGLTAFALGSVLGIFLATKDKKRIIPIAIVNSLLLAIALYLGRVVLGENKSELINLFYIAFLICPLLIQNINNKKDLK